MKRWWVVGAAVVLVAAIAWWLRRPAPPPAQPTTGSATPAPVATSRAPRPAVARAAITGSVRDDAGAPLRTARVCIDERCVDAVDGRYRLDDVAPGAYEVAAAATRHRPTTVDVVLDPGEQRTVDLVLAFGGSELTGVVEDLLGGPIAKARVTAGGVHTETDDAGRFAMWVDEGVQLVRTRASGYGPDRRYVLPPGPATITLAPESTIEGRVIDARGAPVAGATVNARSTSSATTITTATSDDDGAFVLEQLPPQRFDVEAVARGAYGRYVGAITVGVGERVDGVIIEVQPARSIIATIAKDEHAACNPFPTLSDWSFELPKPTRDDEGRYHFDGVPPGTYAVDLGCGTDTPLVVVGNEDVTVTWRIRGGGTVRGRVHAELEPGDRNTIQVEGSGPASRWRSRRAPLMRDGTFELRGIPAGRYVLTATTGRAVAQSEPFAVVDGQTVERDLTIPRATGRITGTIIDDKGRAVTADAHVRVVGPSPTIEVAARDGRFEATKLPSGRYTVRASTPERTGTQMVEVADGHTATVQIALTDKPEKHPFDRAPPTSTPFELTGRVIDASDVPVAGALVVVSNNSAMRATTRDDGRFTLASADPEVYVGAYRVGGGSTRTKLVHGTPATIRLQPPTRLTGTVTRHDGRPAEQFALRVDTSTHTFAHTRGRFALDVAGIPVEIVPVVNNVDGTPVRVDAPRELALTLPPVATVRGRILDAATQQPIAGVRVHGRPDVDGAALWFIHADQITDADGRFTMRDVPPGRLRLELLPPSDTWSKQTLTITVPDRDGELPTISLAQVRRR